MKVMMLAVIQENKKIIGYRLMDVTNKEAKYMDVPVDSVKQAIQSGKAEVENLGLQNGELVGTNGSIERYSKIARNGVLISKSSPLVIVNQIGDAGYTVIDYKGVIKKARTNDVVQYAKNSGIANGKVVIKDNIEFISSITGTYDIENVVEGKIKNNNDALKIHIAVSHNRPTGSVAKNTDIDVSVEISDSDVFKAMSKIQKEILKNYYVWYTVDAYKSLAKSIRFNIAVGKVEKLSELRGEAAWEFGGVWDTGFTGGSKCEFGHNLRYEYYAVPSDDRDNEDARIIFGETCASDFFHIDKDDMDKLVKVRSIMSEEIKLMADILANEQEKVYYEKASMLYSVLRKLRTQENIKEVFGEKVGSTLINFVYAKLPFPMSLVLEASKNIKNKEIKFFTSVFPEYKGTIQEIFNEATQASLMVGAKEYLTFIVNNKIEGDYAYNPLDDTIKRKDIGKYNKDTRADRATLLRLISSKALCNKFNYKELESLLYTVDSLIELRGRFKNKFNGTSVLENNKRSIVSKARRFIEAGSVDVYERHVRAIMFNCITINKETADRYNRIAYFDANTGYVRDQRYIDFLQCELKELDRKQFEDTLNSFYESLEEEEITRNELIKEKDKQERIEQERAAILKAHEERIAKEKAEYLRQKEQERLEQEKENQIKANKDDSDKIETLKELLKVMSDVRVDDGIKVATAIIDSGKSYSELTPKQKWRIDNTIKQLTDGIKEVDENKSYKLDEHSDISNKVQRVIANADSVEMQEVLEKYPNTIKIAYSIVKYNKASDKQMKYIDYAIEVLDKA